MKTLWPFLLLFTSTLLEGCPRPPKPPEPSVSRLELWQKTDCELVYRSDAARVVENFCGTHWKPVKVYIQDQKYSLDWVDKKASHRLFEHGCKHPSACFYELKLDGLTLNGRFAYVAGMVQGEYTFEVDANENSKLLSETVAAVNENAG